MKGFLQIQQEGIKLNPKLTKTFIKTLISDLGLKLSQCGEYSLWGYPKELPKIYYIVKKGTKQSKVLRDIKPTTMNHYINNTFLSIDEKITYLEEENKQITNELLILKTKKKLNQFQDNTRNLIEYIAINEVKTK